MSKPTVPGNISNPLADLLFRKVEPPLTQEQALSAAALILAGLAEVEAIAEKLDCEKAQETAAALQMMLRAEAAERRAEAAEAQANAWRKAARRMYNVYGEGNRKGRPMDVNMQTTIGTGRWRRSVEIIAVGVAVVVVRDGKGYTRTIPKGATDGVASTEATKATNDANQGKARGSGPKKKRHRQLQGQD